MLISRRGWYTKALNVTDIILNKMLILPENWNQTALLVFMDMASSTCFLRGIHAMDIFKNTLLFPMPPYDFIQGAYYPC